MSKKAGNAPPREKSMLTTRENYNKMNAHLKSDLMRKFDYSKLNAGVGSELSRKVDLARQA